MKKRKTNAPIPAYMPVFFVAGIFTGLLTMAKRHKGNNEERKGEKGNMLQALEDKAEALKRSEQLYHKLVDEVKDYAIFRLDKNGIIENWNLGAERIKGYRADEIIGKNFRIFYTPEEQEKGTPYRMLQEAAKNGSASIEGWRVRKDGTTFWASVVITAIHDENGKVIGFTKVTRDMTDKKKMENQLQNYAQQVEESNQQLQQRNKELESFSYVASHDLKEPLRKIQTFSHRLLEKETEALSPNGKEYFRRIIDATGRMQQLIEDLLTFSRATSSHLEFEDVDLNNLLEEVKSNLKVSIDESHASIKTGKLPTLRAIPFQMQQVFQNLISNSIKYKKENIDPKVEISSKEMTGSDIESYRGDPDSKYIMISFKDNGIGFNPEYEHKIFELFQRLHGKDKYSGSGVGLAICKKIMENHGGFMRARGKPKGGATFQLFLPKPFTSNNGLLV